MQESQDNGGCSQSCGCHIDVFSTDLKCQQCGGRLRLAGRSQLMEFRLECSGCGHSGALLTQEELHKIL